MATVYYKQDRQCTHNVTLRRVHESCRGKAIRVTHFSLYAHAGECMCVRACGCTGACSLTYTARNVHEPYCLRPLWLHHIFPHYLINGTTFGEKKKFLNMKCVLWFSLQLLLETFLIPKKISDIIQLCTQWDVACLKILGTSIYCSACSLSSDSSTLLRSGPVTVSLLALLIGYMAIWLLQNTAGLTYDVNSWRSTWYSSLNFINSPVSGAGNVSEPRLTSQCAKSCARRSVCFCSQGGAGASNGLLT